MISSSIYSLYYTWCTNFSDLWFQCNIVSNLFELWFENENIAVDDYLFMVYVHFFENELCPN